MSPGRGLLLASLRPRRSYLRATLRLAAGLTASPSFSSPSFSSVTASSAVSSFTSSLPSFLSAALAWCGGKSVSSSPTSNSNVPVGCADPLFSYDPERCPNMSLSRHQPLRSTSETISNTALPLGAGLTFTANVWRSLLPPPRPPRPPPPDSPSLTMNRTSCPTLTASSPPLTSVKWKNKSWVRSQHLMNPKEAFMMTTTPYSNPSSAPASP
mmetsp:Transcript_5423/g.23993  ORF Transcript_5423/g.23993 Transcript_5423/m.23993 type:complete len:212 (-) Transcript_5423:2365-3000(-)